MTFDDGNCELLSSGQLVKARELFPHTTQGKVYLNHAATSPLSTRVVNAVMAHLHERSTGTIDSYASDVQKKDECKSCVQKLIQAESVDRIALVGNTSDALNIIASGITWKTGDHILLNDMEFPANVYPYVNLRRLGAELDFVRCAHGKITPEMIEEALTPRTRVVALSAVQFLSGYRADMAAIGEICRRRGIFFAVDGIKIISPTSPQERAGIVTIQLPPQVDANAVFQSLSSQNITISLREGKLRYSPHFYNSPEEVTTAVEVTREYLRKFL